MKVAYIGPAYGTSLHRANALERLGHKATIIDPWRWLGHSKWVAFWLHHLGGLGLDLLIETKLRHAIRDAKPDLIWINDGSFFGPYFIKHLRQHNAPIINYSGDNPYAEGCERRWFAFRKSLKYYDLIVTIFDDVRKKLELDGARKVIRVYLSADELIHRPMELSNEDYNKYGGDVSYIAQWTPERGFFMSELLKRGIPLSIWGMRWEKAKEWPLLKKAWRGSAMFDCRFTKVIQASKINLCLLYKAANNLHTSRSIEIPSIGGLLCAERSTEHKMLYEEGLEAVFWSDVDECASLCNDLLAHEERRREIARRGYQRAVRNNLFNEPVLASVLTSVPGL